MGSDAPGTSSTGAAPFWRCPYFVMLTFLVGIYMVSPFTQPGPGLSRAGLVLATCAAMVIGVRHATCANGYRRVVYTLAAVVVALNCYELWVAGDDLTALSRGCTTLMIAVTIAAILISLMRAKRVDADKLNAAVCVLFMLGILFGFLYSALDIVLDPGFEHSIDHGGERDEREFFYFSFVTLTTMGYGDITPSHPLTRTLATLEAMAGQIYLTVLIARLVALHIIHSQDESETA